MCNTQVRTTTTTTTTTTTRSSICSVVWSRRQPMANVGAVPSLLDGPTGCDLVILCSMVPFSLPS